MFRCISRSFMYCYVFLREPCFTIFEKTSHRIKEIFLVQTCNFNRQALETCIVYNDDDKYQGSRIIETEKIDTVSNIFFFYRVAI